MQEDGGHASLASVPSTSLTILRARAIKRDGRITITSQHSLSCRKTGNPQTVDVFRAGFDLSDGSPAQPWTEETKIITYRKLMRAVIPPHPLR